MAICRVNNAVVQKAKTTQVPPDLGVCNANVAAVTSIPASTFIHQIISLTMSEVSQHYELDGDIRVTEASTQQKGAGVVNSHRPTNSSTMVETQCSRRMSSLDTDKPHRQTLAAADPAQELYH